jgi:hypothetical protein
MVQGEKSSHSPVSGKPDKERLKTGAANLYDAEVPPHTSQSGAKAIEGWYAVTTKMRREPVQGPSAFLPASAAYPWDSSPPKDVLLHGFLNGRTRTRSTPNSSGVVPDARRGLSRPPKDHGPDGPWDSGHGDAAEAVAPGSLAA